MIAGEGDDGVCTSLFETQVSLDVLHSLIDFLKTPIGASFVRAGAGDMSLKIRDFRNAM